MGKDQAHLALIKNSWDIDLSVTQLLDYPGRYQNNNAENQRLLKLSKDEMNKKSQPPPPQNNRNNFRT